MAQRTVALCDGKYIGIETIYTAIYGRQINIPEKLLELRLKSKNNELYCPCGCGSNLTLVAGDKNLREQHFRIKAGSSNDDCNVITEGKVSLNSKIVLKCWLDDKLKATDIETRVPIQSVDDINRKYEFSFLSREKNIALSYCHERVNLSEEKLNILESNSQGIHIIYIVDSSNGGCDGQYPESLMKIQNKQGYCLLLEVVEADYGEAELEAIFYAKDIDGLWREVSFAVGKLNEFDIDKNGTISVSGQVLEALKKDTECKFIQNNETEKVRRIEEEKRRVENIKRIKEEEKVRWEVQQKELDEAEKERRQKAEEVQHHRAKLEEKQRVEEEKRQAEVKQREEEFKRNIDSDFSQQIKQVRDTEGNRWIKCEFCGKIAKENEFTSYGGDGHINLGTCKECSDHNPAVKQKAQEESTNIIPKNDTNVCPDCGEKLRERNGPYGRFLGCSSYPACRYNRKIRN